MSYPQNENMMAEIEVLLANVQGAGDAIEAVDISAIDHVATMVDSRMITGIPSADTAAAKVDFTDGAGVTKTTSVPMRNGVFHLRNITKVYKTGTTGLTVIALHR